MRLIHKVNDVRLIDTPRYWEVQVYILFDNSYNYDQSYQWISVSGGQYRHYQEARNRYKNELAARNYLPTN